MPSCRSIAFALLILAGIAPPAAFALTVSGSTYTVNNTVFGDNQLAILSGGHFVANNSTVNVSNAYLGYLGVGTGAISLNSGTMTTGRLFLGEYNSISQSSGIGHFIQTGGSHNVGTFVIGNGLLSVGVYDLFGGELNAGKVQFGSEPFRQAEMVIQGGTLSTSGFLQTSPNWSTLTLNGGRLRATASESAWVTSRINTRIGNHTTTIDTNGYSIGIYANLNHLDGANATDGGIIITGGGRLNLVAANNFTGQTQLNGATLDLTNANSLYRSTLNVVNGTVFFNNANSTTYLGGLAGGGTITLDHFGTTPFSLDVGGNHENTTYAGQLRGLGSLVKSGVGALTLTGLNAYSGGTVVNSGTLILTENPDTGEGTIRGNLTVNNAVVVAASNNALGWTEGVKVDAVTINSGTLATTAASDQGWGVAYTLNNALLSSNGGESSATANSKFAFGGNAGRNTSVLVESGSSTIAGRVVLRDDHGHTNTDFTVNAGSTLLVSAAITNTGSAGFTKLGAGSMVLTGSNTYSGATRIADGTLVARNNRALGVGAVTVAGGLLLVDDGYSLANEVLLGGGAYQRTISGDLAGKIDDTSAIAGGHATTASILASSGTTAQTITTSFSATSSAGNDQLRSSDIYHLEGTGSTIFVLDLSSFSSSPEEVLGWLDGDNDWVNATEGNSLNTATEAMKNYHGTWSDFLAEFQPVHGADLSAYLGAYGYYDDGIASGAWAVLDHNSAFAVIPEPGTVALMGLGALALLARRRTR